MVPPALLLLAALGSDPEPGFSWDARAAEHLLNRAGFGAAPAEIARAVELGREAVVEELLAGAGGPGQALGSPRRELRPGLPLPEPGIPGPLRAPGEVRVPWPEYLEEMGLYLEAWFDAMVRGSDPLRDRMALFWHNHFVSSFAEVGDGHKMVVQASFLRAHGLGPFRVLAQGMARDPAMLEYLNNNINVKEHPNENWARELMELFVLGEGHYTETDVKEVARAFTGWTDRDYRFVFDHVQHDFGPKTVLGLSGNLDGDEVIDHLLEQPACGRWLAWKLLVYFEGAPPAEERLEQYAQVLRESGYDVAGFLRHLFLDDAFYRPEIVGARVTSPVDYLVGALRRLEVAAPPQMLFAGADLLGQRVFYPPSVKGWEGGMTWLPTAAVLQRSNVAGALLGLVDLAQLKQGDEAGSPAALDLGKLKQNDPLRILVGIPESGWRLALDTADHLSGDAAADAHALAGRLLPSAPEPEFIDWVARLLAAGPATADGSPDLRRAVHAVLSRPEAMLD